MSSTPTEARQVAARVAARANILNIRAVSVRADLVQATESGRRLTYALDTEVTLQWEKDQPSHFVVQTAFDLRLSMLPVGEDPPEDPEGDRDDGDVLATIRFELQGYFSLDMLDDDEPPTEEEMEAYAQTTGLFALYPFAREWAHDLTGRLGLPPLTLAVSLLALDGPK